MCTLPAWPCHHLEDGWFTSPEKAEGRGLGRTGAKGRCSPCFPLTQPSTPQGHPFSSLPQCPPGQQGPLGMGLASRTLKGRTAREREKETHRFHRAAARAAGRGGGQVQGYSHLGLPGAGSQRRSGPWNQGWCRERTIWKDPGPPGTVGTRGLLAVGVRTASAGHQAWLIFFLFL